MRTAEKADRVPDRNIDAATVKYIKEREAINGGYAKAFEYELANTHLDKGKKGGEGRLYWTNK